MLQLFDQSTYQKTLTSFVEDFHAKHSAWLDTEKASMTQEVLYFLKLHDFLDISESLGNQSHTLYSRMLKAYLTTTVDSHLILSTEFLPTLIIPLNASYSILSGFYPKIERESTLLDILETKEVDQKYFLSQKAFKRVTTSERGVPPIDIQEL